jgi:hypothetical protein
VDLRDLAAATPMARDHNGGSRLSGNYGHAARTGRARRATRAPLARHIDDFLTDLANANKPRNMIRAYRGDLTGFAAHHTAT